MREFVEKLIDRLEEYKYSHLIERDSGQSEHCLGQDDCEMMDCTLCVWDKAKEIVNQLAEEHNNGWIPCSERLPEENAVVLTCDKEGWISVNVYMPYMGARNDFECGYYEAWRPLPEPYKPKGDIHGTE